MYTLSTLDISTCMSSLKRKLFRNLFIYHIVDVLLGLPVTQTHSEVVPVRSSKGDSRYHRTH